MPKSDLIQPARKLSDLDLDPTGIQVGYRPAWDGSKWVVSSPGGPYVPLAGGTLSGNLDAATHALLASTFTIHAGGSIVDDALGVPMYSSDASFASFLNGEMTFDLNGNTWNFASPIQDLAVVGSSVITTQASGYNVPFFINTGTGAPLFTFTSNATNNNDISMGGQSFCQVYNSDAYFANFMNAAIFRCTHVKFNGATDVAMNDGSGTGGGTLKMDAGTIEAVGSIDLTNASVQMPSIGGSPMDGSTIVGWIQVSVGGTTRYLPYYS